MIRWAECVFTVSALVLFLFLPFPPHRAEMAASLVLGLGMVVARLVWWGLRSARRIAWWAAFALAGAWLLNSIRIIGQFWQMVISGLTGHYAGYDAGNAVVLSYLFASVPIVAQAIVLVAWLRGTSLSTASTKPAA
ncbi:MAG TPA: hypothetical protein VFA43_25250 [Gemmatimonadaceae bacterium]|nr:hypothetical protein [Gemmatimonadaceae bacterium]